MGLKPIDFALILWCVLHTSYAVCAQHALNDDNYSDS